MTIRRGKRKGEAVAKLRDGNPPPAGTARAGTGLDLQDAGADRASQGRTGFAYRGATGARRRPALPGARTPPTKRTGKARRFRFGPILPPIFGNGLPTRRRLAGSRQSAPAVRFDSKHQKRGKRNQGDSTGPEGQSCLPLTAGVAGRYAAVHRAGRAGADPRPGPWRLRRVIARRRGRTGPDG